MGREEKRGEGGYQNDVGAWFIARPSDQLSRVAWNVRGFFFFWPSHMACGILVPQQGMNLSALEWKYGVPTTEPPGMSEGMTRFNLQISLSWEILHLGKFGQWATSAICTFPHNQAINSVP